MNRDYNTLKSLVNNLQISVNTLSSSFQNIQNIYKNSNNNLNIEPIIINNNDQNKYIDDQINNTIKQYIDTIDIKIKKLISDNNEFTKLITDKINNNKEIDKADLNDLIIKNNLYINQKMDDFTDRIDNLEFNNNQSLRTDEIIKIKSLIHSQDDIYKCMNDDIKEVKNDCKLLRDKIIDNWCEVIEITKILQNQLNENKISIKNEIALLKDIYNDLKNDYEKLKNDNEKLKNDNDNFKNDFEILKDDINKLKTAMKIILSKIKN